LKPRPDRFSKPVRSEVENIFRYHIKLADVLFLFADETIQFSEGSHPVTGMNDLIFPYNPILIVNTWYTAKDFDKFGENRKNDDK